MVIVITNVKINIKEFFSHVIHAPIFHANLYG